MKKIISFLLIIFFVFQHNLKAQETKESNNLFSFSIPRLFMSNMMFGYERLFNTTGLVINAGVTLKDNNSETLTGYNVELQCRLYPAIHRESAFQGIYLAPYVSYKRLDEELNYTFPGPQKYYYNDYGVGVLFGLKLAIAQKIVFTYELGGGLKYSDNNRGSTSNIIKPGYTGIAPKADITLGYFF